MTIPRTYRWAVAMTLLVAGCSDLKSSLLSMHNSKRRKEEAQEHWDSVRGGVKLQLARQHLQSGRLDEAEKIINQAVALSSRDPQAFILLAKLRLEQGQLAEAKAAMTQAAALAPGNPEISYLSGVIAQRYGDLEMAAEYYTAAVKSAPNVVDYLLAEAETLVALDRNLDALELVESRISDFDSQASMQMLAARICRIVGLRQPAIDHCHEAMNLAPDDRMMASDCGQIFVWAGRNSDAISVLAPLQHSSQNDHPILHMTRKPEPMTSGARRCLAAAYIASGKSADALKCIRAALEDSEVDTSSLMLCARAAINVEDVETASRALRMLHERTADTAETLLLDGYVAFLRGDYGKAFNFANRAIQLDERLMPAHCLKGRSAQSSGRLEDARQAYATALALDSSAPIAASRIAELTQPVHCTVEEGLQLVEPEAIKGQVPVTRFAP